MDHYFSADPASASERRGLTVTLDGHAYSLDTAHGVFSPGRVDLGTAVLLDTVGKPPAGRLLDLGCGWGPIALTAALRQSDAHIIALDVNQRAMELLRTNVERVRESAPELAPIDVMTAADVPPTMLFDAVWSNPPIRIGKEALHGLLAAWLPRLAPGGEAWLVVQRHLGADSLAGWIAEQADDSGVPWGEVERVRSAKGYRVLRLTAP